MSLTGELRFTAWTPPIGWDGGGLTGAVATRHYEQPGSIAGVLEVDGRRWPLHGAGLRDHSWGVRDWQGVPFWRWFGMVVDPDTFVLANEVGTAEGGTTAGGWVMRDGELAAVTAIDNDVELDADLGCQKRFRAQVRDALGREQVLEGDALSVAPLRQRRDGRLTLVNEGLTRMRWDGREGIGLSEFLLQEAAVNA